MAVFQASDGLALSYCIDDFSDPWRPVRNVVLLHSAMSSKERYFGWMPQLSREFRVIRLDTRGHGESGMPPADSGLSVARLTQDVVELLDHLDIRQAHFVGSSAGGYICQRLAIEVPDRVLSISMFGSTPGFKGGQTAKWLPRIRQNGLRNFLADTIDDRLPIGQVDPALVDWFLDQAGGNDPEYIARFMGLMDGEDWSDELKQIRCPALLVIPGLGKIGDYSGFDRMRAAIPQMAVKTYEGMPHNVWDSVPQRCAAEVIDFINNGAGKAPAGSGA